ncbi:MAG: type 4a pilus biogenesis protein PilO [Chitinivibrionales bacterium]|nr:type 4a pilus biogenesis protein PilO [Chitinivibrionales bacterium]
MNTSKPQKQKGTVVLGIVIVLTLAVIVFDRVYVAQYEKKYKHLEQQRINTANKLTTAKIVQENLNHVEELVFLNMDFKNQQDTIPHQTHFFKFLTTCVNDLKIRLVSIAPTEPQVSGSVTAYGYDIEVVGDFFSFGELCAKFENSRRIMSIDDFEISAEGRSGSHIRAKIHVSTYRIRKG